MLQRHRAEMEEGRAVRGEAALSEYVFVTEMGQPLNPAGITRRLHALQAACGLPLITLHDLGHTSATLALMAGVHPKVVTERHGHASTQIALDRYSHVVESMQVDAAEAIGRFFKRLNELATSTSFFVRDACVPSIRYEAYADTSSTDSPDSCRRRVIPR